MEFITTIGLIFVTVFVAIYVVDKYVNSRAITPEAMKSIRSAAFLNAYMNDDFTQNEFAGKSIDESMEKGQDILWAEVEKFGKEFSISVMEPSEEHLEQAFASAVRIVKCAHMMRVIQDTGPFPVLKTEDEDAA